MWQRSVAAVLVLSAIALIGAIALNRDRFEVLRLRSKLSDPRLCWSAESDAAADRLVEIDGARALPALLRCLKLHARAASRHLGSGSWPRALTLTLADEMVDARFARDLVEVLDAVPEAAPAGAADVDHALLILGIFDRLTALDAAAAAGVFPHALRALDARIPEEEGVTLTCMLDMRRALVEHGADIEEQGLLPGDAVLASVTKELALQRVRFKKHAPRAGARVNDCLLFLDTTRRTSVASQHPIVIERARLLLDGGDAEGVIEWKDLLASLDPAEASLLDCSTPARCPIAFARTHGARRAAFALTIAIRAASLDIAVRCDVRSNWLDVPLVSAMTSAHPAR